MAWTAKIEVAFASQPMVASPVWTDITPYVWTSNPIVPTVGRRDESGEAPPSTLQLRLNNSDGRFTQGRAASPYYPNVKLGRRIRVTMIRNAASYVRFDGHVDRWPTEWAFGVPSLAVADITATDRRKRMSEAGELRSMVEHEILRDGPTVYYPLGEATGATSAADATGNLQPAARIVQKNAGGAVDFGGQGPGSDSQAVSFAPASAGSGKRLEVSPLAVAVEGAAVTLECFVRCQPTVTQRMIAALTNATGLVLRLGISVGGFLQAQLIDENGAQYTIQSDAGAGSPVVNDDQWHHCAVKDNWNSGSPVSTLYLDGEVMTGDISYDRTSVLSFDRLIVGGNKGGEHLEGSAAHVAGFSAGLADATVLRHADAGLNGLAGERSDVRVGRVADYAAIPVADRAFDVGDSLVGAQNLAGRNPIEVMQEVTDTENGVLFIDPATGKLTFHNRSRRYNQSPAVTLVAAQIGPDLAFPADDSHMVNDQTVTTPDGAGARHLDQASIDEYGLYRPPALQTVAADPGAALSVAAWRVDAYGQPRIRTPSVTVRLHRLEEIAPSLIPALLALTIGSKVRLAELPTQAPASTVDVMVEGWQEEITLVSWTITFNTSPADIWDVWQLNVAGHDELGTTTILAQGGPI